jgi:hypothetical protein
LFPLGQLEFLVLPEIQVSLDRTVVQELPMPQQHPEYPEMLVSQA